MINEEWGGGEKNPQNDAGPLSPFTTCVLTRLLCQMKWQMCRSRECSSLFLYPDYITRGLTGSDSRSKPYLHQGGKEIWNKKYQPAAILRIRRQAVVRLSFQSPPTACHRERPRSYSVH